MEQILTIFLYIVILIILLWIIVKFYQYYSRSNPNLKNYTKLMTNSADAKISNVISGTNIPISSFSSEYAFSFWIRIDDYNYRYKQEKIIMTRGTTDATMNPKVSLGGSSNSLIVKIGLQSQDPTNLSLNIPMGSGSGNNVSSNESGSGNESGSVNSTMPTPTPTASGENFSNLTGNFINNGTRVHMSSAISDNSAPKSASLYDAATHNEVSGNILSETGFTDDSTKDPKWIKKYGVFTNLENTMMNVGTTATTNNYTIPDVSGLVISGWSDKDITVPSKERFDNSSNEKQHEKDNKIGVCMVNELPLQKWVHIVISVYNNIVDIYTDGKLSSSCVLNGFPISSTADLKIAPEGGFSGNISNITSVNAALSPSEVTKLYNESPMYSKGFYGTLSSTASSLNVFGWGES